MTTGTATAIEMATAGRPDEPLLDRLAERLDSVADRVPELVDLPAWIDPTFLRAAAIVAIVVSLLLVVLAIRIIRRLVLRALVILALTALAAGLWSQRVALADCAAECSCALFGQVVKVPEDLNPNC